MRKCLDRVLPDGTFLYLAGRLFHTQGGAKVKRLRLQNATLRTARVTVGMGICIRIPKQRSALPPPCAVKQRIFRTPPPPTRLMQNRNLHYRRFCIEVLWFVSSTISLRVLESMELWLMSTNSLNFFL